MSKPLHLTSAPRAPRSAERWGRVIAVAAPLTLTSALAWSETMSPHEVAMAYESMVVDFDAQILAADLGLAPGSQLRYLSAWTSDSWTGRLSVTSGDRALDVIYQGQFDALSSQSWALSLHSDWYENGLAYGSMSGTTSYTLATEPTTPQIITLGGSGRGGGGCVKCQNGVTEPVDLGDLPLSIFGGRLGVRVGAGVGLAGAASLVEFNVSAGKDFPGQVFYASADVRVLTLGPVSLARDSLVFELDQRTSSYRSVNEWEALVVFSGRSIVNQGRLVDEPPSDPGTGSPGDVLTDPGRDIDDGWVDGGSWDGSYDGSLNTMTLTVSSVPEPAALALWLGGLALVTVARRRSRT